MKHLLWPNQHSEINQRRYGRGSGILRAEMQNFVNGRMFISVLTRSFDGFVFSSGSIILAT